MKIAVVSDTHDNLKNFKKAISLIKKKKIKFLIHCGDIFEPETVKEILKNFQGEAYFVLSDVDEEYFGKIEKDCFIDFHRLKIWKEFGEIEIGKKKIAFTHSPILAKDLALSQKYNIVFYGHTHKPWEEKIGKTKLVNPGNISGLFFKATFAIYDTITDKLELNPVVEFRITS